MSETDLTTIPPAVRAPVVQLARQRAAATLRAMGQPGWRLTPLEHLSALYLCAVLDVAEAWARRHDAAEPTP